MAGEDVTQTTPKLRGPEPSRYGRNGRLIGDQRHYQRSSCNNPFVSQPEHWEHPIGVATRTTPKTAWAPLGKPRPVNKRNYWTPSFWVQKVEKGETNASCTYLDYSFTDDFNKVWKEELKKEKRFQQNAAKPQTRRPHEASSSAAEGRPKTVVIGTGESEYRTAFGKDGFGLSLMESVCSKVPSTPNSNRRSDRSVTQRLAPARSAPALMSGTHNAPTLTAVNSLRQTK